jgi:hypothetical protein
MFTHPLSNSNGKAANSSPSLALFTVFRVIVFQRSPFLWWRQGEALAKGLTDRQILQHSQSTLLRRQSPSTNDRMQWNELASNSGTGIGASLFPFPKSLFFPPPKVHNYPFLPS